MARWLGRDLETGREYEGDDDDMEETAPGRWNADTNRRLLQQGKGTVEGHQQGQN